MSDKRVNSHKIGQAWKCESIAESSRVQRHWG